MQERRNSAQNFCTFIAITKVFENIAYNLINIRKIFPSIRFNSYTNSHVITCLEEVIMLNDFQKYRFACTLKFGDIYGQIVIWLIVIFLGLATSMAMYQNPINAILAGGLILVLSLPFLLFAFVTTLLNHIELSPVSATSTSPSSNPPGTRSSSSEVAAAS
jgi:hypothetical protein